MNDKIRTQYIEAIPAILAVVCLAGCFYFWFQLTGRENGMFYGVFADPPSNGIIAHGQNLFSTINTRYFVISVCLMVYVLLGRMATTRTVFALRIIALSIATFPLHNMLNDKYVGLSFRQSLAWFQTSLYFDLFTAAAMVAIIGIEIFALISQSKSLDKTVPETS